jgi:SAM-dependent methyltransferase
VRRTRITLVLCVCVFGLSSWAAEHRITTHNGDAFVLRFDSPQVVIERSPGRHHSWGHPGCLMCLHNHLVGTHKQGADYLRRSGWAAWTTIHDNLHNDPSFKGQSGSRRYVGHNINAPKEPSAFAPTPLDVCEEMLDLASIDSNDIVYDLGCGDGRILVIAALKFGCRAVGVDSDPTRVRESNENIRRYHVDHLAKAYECDARQADISGASVLTLYLMPSLTAELRPRLQGLPVGTRIVAHDKPIPNWLPHGEIPMVSSADNYRHTIYLWKTVARQEQKAKPRCKT